MFASWETQNDGELDVFQAVSWYSDMNADQQSKLVDRLRAHELSFGAAVFRFELVFHRWPYMWLHPHMDTAFRNAYTCDLESWFSFGLHRVLSTMRPPEPGDLAMLRGKLARTARATNMRLERQLSSLRAAVPFSKHAPNAETLVYGGHLQRLMQNHISAGG